MSPHKQRFYLRIPIMLGLLLCLLLGNLVLITPIHAELPPRPPLPVADEEDEPTRPLVAPLILSTDPSRSDLWSIVQWQDAQGDWQAVTGWQGTVVNGRTTWWVEEKDFNKGPFRWVIQAGEGGAVVATSAEFRLPGEARKALVVEVTVP